MSKSDSEVTTLIEGDLNDIGDTIRDAAQDAINEAMSEQQIVLGELCMQLQKLGIWIAPMGTSATQGVPGMITIEPLLKAQMAHTIAIPGGALITTNAEDRVVLG